MAADIVITKPAKKEVAIKRAAAKSVVVDPSAGGGGGGGVKLIPTVEVSGDNLIFHFVTLQQMTMMHVSVSGGSIGFELIEDEEDFQLRYSQDSPSPLVGEIVYEDSIAIKDYVFGSILVAMNGNIATYVIIDGVDANLLEADINWRLADIQQKAADLDGVAQEATSQEILTKTAKQGANPNATNTAILAAVTTVLDDYANQLWSIVGRPQNSNS